MSKMNRVVYFVEGECEEKLINALKEKPSKVHPGKVKKVNMIQNELSKSQLVQIQAGTVVVLVFDTDVPVTDCLKKNIKLLEEKCTRVLCETLYSFRHTANKVIVLQSIDIHLEDRGSEKQKDSKTQSKPLVN